MWTSVAVPVLIFLCAAGSVGALLAATLYPQLSAASPLDRRIERISSTGNTAAGSASTPDQNPRRRTVEATLREAEEKQQGRGRAMGKPALAVRLRQADLSWSNSTCLLICLGTGASYFLVLLGASGLGLPSALGFGLAAGLLLPHRYVSHRRNRRFGRFEAEFPNAIDIIVRGIKSGLPLVDCLKIVAADAGEPVRGEFKAIIEDQAVGVPLDEAVQRLPQRIPLSDASFFAIVIAIQSRTGGSLSEALGNLSKVLRERKKMKGRIKALSAESKASGSIIGCLPVAVASILYLTSPDYIGLLFTELAGNFVLAACGVWMLMGVLVMRKMINFDF